ncbi:MAG: hypothetical protein NTZ78_09405 [Candidatus Aureabacteria bacterium]|nr:hypothetical protein [Candidatus Auribacterota bacterium]
MYSIELLSIQLIRSATLFAQKALEIESECLRKKEGKNEKNSEHASYVIGSIITATASLEANINEIFCDAARLGHGKLNKLTSDLMRKMWKHGIPRTSSFTILEKYEIALNLSNKDDFDHGKFPYQDVHLLIKIRNALMHYEPVPELIGEKSREKVKGIARCEEAFRGRFDFNPLTGIGNPFFPDKCLGFGCAEWAVKSCIAFVDDFSSRMGIESKFRRVKSVIKIE